MGVQEIIAGSGAARYEDSEGTVEFVAKPGPLTLSRVTQDPDGAWKVAIVEGAFEDNPAVTFGSYCWCRIPNLQNLYRNVAFLAYTFPHHVAITQGPLRQRAVGRLFWKSIWASACTTASRLRPASTRRRYPFSVGVASV